MKIFLCFLAMSIGFAAHAFENSNPGTCPEAFRVSYKIKFYLEQKKVAIQESGFKRQICEISGSYPGIQIPVRENFLPLQCSNLMNIISECAFQVGTKKLKTILGLSTYLVMRNGVTHKIYAGGINLFPAVPDLPWKKHTYTLDVPLTNKGATVALIAKPFYSGNTVDDVIENLIHAEIEFTESNL